MRKAISSGLRTWTNSTLVPVREEGAGGDLGAELLPGEVVGAEVFGVDEEDEVGVADVDHGSGDGTYAGDVDGAGHDAGETHAGADEEVRVAGFDDLAGRGGPPWVSRMTWVRPSVAASQAADAAGAVAGELGFGSVGVEEADEEGSVGAAVEELDAVGADGVGAVAELAG